MSGTPSEHPLEERDVLVGDALEHALADEVRRRADRRPHAADRRAERRHQHHRGREVAARDLGLRGPSVRWATIDSPIGNIIAVVAVLLIHIEMPVATAP